MQKTCQTVFTSITHFSLYRSLQVTYLVVENRGFVEIYAAHLQAVENFTPIICVSGCFLYI